MKRFISIALLAAVAAFAAVAQSAPAAKASPESRLFNIEAGVMVGYDLGDAAVAGGTSFGFNLSVADNVSVGIQSATVPTSATAPKFNTFKLTYYLTPSIGFSANIGKETTAAVAAAGFGTFFILGRSTPETGLSSAYKIKADYLFPTNDIASGTFAVSAAISLGL